MRKAKIQQGMRKNILFVYNLFFFLSPHVFATTFGPIQVPQQIRNAPYFIQGRISSAARVEMERKHQLPFTYWDIQVIQQLTGNPLRDTLTIREAGGEIGELGYHVAGSARFSEGEEVFVALRDTDEGTHVKEIVGLTSGKYTIERDSSGKETIRNGLGFPLQNAKGEKINVKELTSLAIRVSQNQETEEDKKIILNTTPTHDHDPVYPEISKNPSQNPQEIKKISPPSAGGNHAENKNINPVQESQSSADEPMKGSWALALGIALLVISLLGVILFKR